MILLLTTYWFINLKKIVRTDFSDQFRKVIIRYKRIGFKVVICGKYKNLNKIIKIQHNSLKFHRLLIFVILHSLQCKIEGHAV